jgi:hypothetical protein
VLNLAVTFDREPEAGTIESIVQGIRQDFGEQADGGYEGPMVTNIRAEVDPTPLSGPGSDATPAVDFLTLAVSFDGPLTPRHRTMIGSRAAEAIFADLAAGNYDGPTVIGVKWGDEYTSAGAIRTTEGDDRPPTWDEIEDLVKDRIEAVKADVDSLRHDLEVRLDDAERRLDEADDHTHHDD